MCNYCVIIRLRSVQPNLITIIINWQTAVAARINSGQSRFILNISPLRAVSCLINDFQFNTWITFGTFETLSPDNRYGMESVSIRYGVNRIFEHGNEEKQTNANGNHNFFPNCFQSIKVQLRGAEQRRVGRGDGFNEAERSIMTSNWCHHIIKHFLHKKLIWQNIYKMSW